ncbi:hypothetical protein ABZ921_39470 [Streptomyces atriruber]|uniref:Uncharacterized protein n=1 Tax=Streptomyces atriruber TaxID=545121 RepID=A0ABV3C0C1_9ACTN
MRPVKLASAKMASLNRRRLLSALALTMAGALLGAGIVAWRTDTLPFFGSQPCWDSVADEDVDDLFDGKDTETSGIRPAWVDDGELQGSCRVMLSGERPRGVTADIRVHKLNGLSQEQLPWAREFLSTRLTPFGHGLLGMASDTRAWVALPDACTGKPGDFDGPGVVDVALGDDEINRSTDADTNARYQKALSRVAVQVANGTMEELGCEGSLDGPGELAPAPAPESFKRMAADREMCGLEGVVLPKAYVGSGARMRASVGGADGADKADGKSPVRGCDVVTGARTRTEVRLRTVQEPDLTGAFGHSVVNLGRGIDAKGGEVEATGSATRTTAALRAECPKGAVVFIAEDEHDTGGHTFVQDVFPSYVAAEAERLGCGPLDIRIRS